MINMDDIKTVTPTNNKAPKPPRNQTGKNKGDKIAILHLSGQYEDEKIKELEEKYSEKFGCKVVILENNLRLVEIYG